MSVLADDPATWLLSALHQLDGRAIGLWRVEADRLVQIAFQAPVIDRETAERFAGATRSLGFDQLDLGIVKAALHRRPEVSLAAELPADIGSGYWLRAFAADRSVAVPLDGTDDRTSWVFSIALGLSPDESEVARILKSVAARHLATHD